MNSYKDKLRSDDLNWAFKNWDDEESWDFIEQRLAEKKRKKIFIIFFSGVGLMTLLATILLLYPNSIFDTENNPLLTEAITQSQQFDQALIQNTDFQIVDLQNKDLQNHIEANQQDDQTIIVDPSIEKENENENKTPNENSSSLITSKDKVDILTSYYSSSEETKDGSQLQEINKTTKPEAKFESLKIIQEEQIIDQATEDSDLQSLTEQPPKKIAIEGSTSKTESSSDAIEFVSDIDKLLLVALKNEIKIKKMTLPFHPLSKLADRKIKVRKPIIVSFSGGYQLFKKHLRALATIEDQNIRMRRMTESPEESIMISARISKQIFGEHWNIYSGLDYVQYNELVRHKFSTVQEELIMTEQASYIDLGSEKRFYFPGFISQTTTVNTTINIYNETYFVNMPIGIEYQHRFDKVSLSAGGGVVLSLYNNQQGDYIDSENILIEKKVGIPIFQKTFLPIGYSGQLQMGYQISPKTNFITTLRYQQLKSPIEKAVQIEEHFRSIGVEMGVLLKL